MSIQALSLAGRPQPTEVSGAQAQAIGLRGATMDFDLTQQGGSATVSMEQGALVLPGVFEEPVLPLDQFHASVQWQIDGERIIHAAIARGA